MSSSSHINNKIKDISVLREEPTQGFEHALTAEKMYSINSTVILSKFTLQRRKQLFVVNGTEICKFKAKSPEIVATPLCLGKFQKIGQQII